MLLASEAAALGESRFAPSRGAQDGGAPVTLDSHLRVTEDGGDHVATWTFDVHKVTVGVLHQPLQFVGSALFIRRGIQ